MSLHDPSPHTVATVLLAQPVASLSTKPSCCSEHAQRPPPLLFKHAPAPFCPLSFHLHCEPAIPVAIAVFTSELQPASYTPPFSDFSSRQELHRTPTSPVSPFPEPSSPFPKSSSGRTKL